MGSYSQYVIQRVKKWALVISLSLQDVALQSPYAPSSTYPVLKQYDLRKTTFNTILKIFMPEIPHLRMEWH